ncbi:MAG TPA: EamA family transporter [Rhodanobacteraceae bacterium]|nr:EamA family transporter [Rhodanobacteraceae bacterium]
MNTRSREMGARAAARRRLTVLIVAWVLLVAIETLGQVAIKLAGTADRGFDLDRESILIAVSTPWLWVGLACYLGAFAVWMNILEKSTLSAAFLTSAIVQVTVMFASWAVLNEPMGWVKVLGAAIIVAGILLLGGDAGPATPAPPHFDEGNRT